MFRIHGFPSEQREQQKTRVRLLSLLKTDGMNLLYLHTLYADSIEPLFADNAGPSTRATPVNVGNMYETFGVSAYSYTGEWNGTQTPNYMYDVLGQQNRQTRGCHHPAITGPAVPIR